MSMMTKSLPQTICKREAALIRRAVAGAPKSETQHSPEQRRLYAAAIAPTRDASGGRRTTAVESEERKPDARTHAGQKKLELHTATRRSKPSTPMREKTANCGHGGRDDLCDGEMRFPALISTRQELRRVWPNAKLTGRTEPACRRSGLQRGIKFAKQMPRCKLSALNALLGQRFNTPN